MKGWILTLALFGAACGSTPPELTDLQLTRTLVERGEEFLAQVHAVDPDGDMAGGTFELKVTLESDSEELELEETLPVEGIDPGATSAEAILALAIGGDKPFGNYRIELVLEDEEGGRSEPVSQVIGCGPPRR